jgi:L-fuculose-phosphate aldolase
MIDAVQAMREKITELGALLFERHLTDTAGGNISARVGDYVCITPRYSGSRYRWQLNPNQVIVADLQGNPIEGDGEISREARVHFKLYHEFADGQAVVHGHARNVLVFCMLAQPIPPVLEDTQKFGVIPVAQYAPAHSPLLAEWICDQMRQMRSALGKQAAAVIAPWHGLFVLGKDLDAAFDAAERIDVNAYCILQGRLLDASLPQEYSQRMLSAFDQYRRDHP